MEIFLQEIMLFLVKANINNEAIDNIKNTIPIFNASRAEITILYFGSINFLFFQYFRVTNNIELHDVYILSIPQALKYQSLQYPTE